jgi:demethylmenaquinone methyltransferase/2-methoxy-6-polyprenyl-1,4-benzoquinol methylase
MRYHALDQDIIMTSDETTNGDSETSFGFGRVATHRKQKLVDDVFDAVADRYDLMNDLMSMGLHREWKDLFVSLVRPSSMKPSRHIDVAGGTGDIAARIARSGTAETDVVVVDINERMLQAGRARTEAARMPAVAANAEALPFGQASFDTYTIAFGIRNVPRIDRALSEAFRVLKYGGRFLCLEFSTVDLPVLNRLYDAYSFRILPALGERVTGAAEPYRYLAESIRTFPAPAEFERRIASAGFERTTVRLLSGGIVAIHMGWKL